MTLFSQRNAIMIRSGIFLIAGLLLSLTPVFGQVSNIAGIAEREAQRRQQMVQSAQTLFTAGSRAYADKSYGEAIDNFKAAFETVPAVPAVDDQRRIFFRRYQAASLAFSKLKVDEARWVEAQDVLQDVINTAQRNSVPDSLVDPGIRKMLEGLREFDDRYNMANSPRHLESVELVESKLVLAKGYLELGDYDRAERSYHQVLAIDRFNSAARRGLENVERHRMDYYDAARDHTRAKMLREVAEGWESQVPSILSEEDMNLSATETAAGGDVLIEQKLNSIIIPSIEFNGARITDVLSMLSTRSQELDSLATDPAKRGVAIVLDPTGSTEASSIPDRLVTVRLSNIPLSSALKYVTQQVGLKYRVDRFAVTVVPENVDTDSGLVIRSFSVPPGFISRGGGGNGASAGPVDPFATPEPDSGVSLQRVSAQDFLEQNGVVFGEGASARFVSATSSLVVRNTAEQMSIVESLVQAAKSSGSKLVKVRVKTISIEETTLKELGLDFLLGASNLGSSPRVFFGGGTNGNAVPGTRAADYTFTQNGIPVGMNPVSAGLRSGDLSTGQSIADVLNRDAPDAGQVKAPGIFSVAGVFTDPQFQVMLRALNQRKASDQLFDAHVVTKPGQIAKIEQIREFIYPTEYDPPEIPNQLGVAPSNIPGFIETNDVVEFPVTPATPTAFETRGLGSIIEVEPIVAADNLTVSVNITADFSDFVGFINYGTPIRNAAFLTVGGEGVVLTDNRILMPVFEAIRETTNVTVWDGQTVAIGGYHGESIIQSNDKVPGLGDLPGVGRAFRSSTGDSTKQALLIFVTIDLIDPCGNPINAKPEDPEPQFTRREPPISPYPAVGAPPAGIYQAK